MTAATRLTAEQYYAETVEGDHKQLVDGEIVEHELPWKHALLQSRALFALATWIDASEGSGLALLPTDIRVDEHNVYGPSAMWFADASPPLNDDGYPANVPELCVEIRSHGIWRYDIGAKKRVYEDRGLPELWLIDDLAETMLVYRRSAPRSRTFDVELELDCNDTLTSPQLPGFELPLSSLFQR